MNQPPTAQPPLRFPATDQYQDEISLFDLWEILVQRRWWVFGTWALTVLIAVAYLLLVSPVFESRAVIRIGRVADELIFPAPALVLQLRERFEVDEPGRKRPYMKSVRQEGDDALVLVAEAYSAGEAQAFLQRSVQDVLDEQRQRYETGRQLQESALQAVTRQIQSLNQQIGQLGASAESAGIDEAVRALLILQRSSLQNDLPKLHEQQLQLQRNMSALKSFPTHSIRVPTLVEKKSKPKTAVTLALSLVLGAVLGTMTAFVVEFIGKAKGRERSGR